MTERDIEIFLTIIEKKNLSLIREYVDWNA